jgi:putative FmdB family regulatory protein
MPLYEYACRGCGNRFEALVRGSDVPTCPSCGSSDLEHLLSMFAVSTAGSRATNFAGAKQRNSREIRDKDIAYHEQTRHHFDGSDQ